MTVGAGHYVLTDWTNDKNGDTIVHTKNNGDYVNFCRLIVHSPSFQGTESVAMTDLLMRTIFSRFIKSPGVAGAHYSALHRTDSQLQRVSPTRHKTQQCSQSLSTSRRQ